MGGTDEQQNLSVYYPVLKEKHMDTDTFKNQKAVFDRFSQHLSRN
jgi:hypothetical protein